MSRFYRREQEPFPWIGQLNQPRFGVFHGARWFHVLRNSSESDRRFTTTLYVEPRNMVILQPKSNGYLFQSVSDVVGNGVDFLDRQVKVFVLMVPRSSPVCCPLLQQGPGHASTWGWRSKFRWSRSGRLPSTFPRNPSRGSVYGEGFIMFAPFWPFWQYSSPTRHFREMYTPSFVPEPYIKHYWNAQNADDFDSQPESVDTLQTSRQTRQPDWTPATRLTPDVQPDWVPADSRTAPTTCRGTFVTPHSRAPTMRTEICLFAFPQYSDNHDLHREAAFNLSLIYKASGSDMLAAELMMKYCWV